MKVRTRNYHSVQSLWLVSAVSRFAAHASMIVPRATYCWHCWYATCRIEINECARAGANFAARLVEITAGDERSVHHIRAEGSHLGAPLYDTAAWAQLIAQTDTILQP